MMVYSNLWYLKYTNSLGAKNMEAVNQILTILWSSKTKMPEFKIL